MDMFNTEDYYGLLRKISEPPDKKFI